MYKLTKASLKEAARLVESRGAMWRFGRDETGIYEWIDAAYTRTVVVVEREGRVVGVLEASKPIRTPVIGFVPHILAITVADEYLGRGGFIVKELLTKLAQACPDSPAALVNPQVTIPIVVAMTKFFGGASIRENLLLPSNVREQCAHIYCLPLKTLAIKARNKT